MKVSDGTPTRLIYIYTYILLRLLSRLRILHASIPDASFCTLLLSLDSDD